MIEFINIFDMLKAFTSPEAGGDQVFITFYYLFPLKI